MFDKVLIANRGEIACRVMRSCRRLGIASVAIYSDADAQAYHVSLADESARVGGAAADSYLNMDRVLEAARRHGAQAIHPGYGFLSENPQFAERCADAGLVFVGPPVAAMRAMSSKSAAKALMQQHAVPLLPGYHGEQQDEATLRAEAERIGYPVLIKAVAGGGGKGMRAVEQAGQFAAHLASCRREALASFRDERVLLEKYLDRPRHVEVQIFADTHGRTVHLFERDCSAQRRHQKVLEEAPAPQFSQELRQALTLAACNAARAVGYVGAGTVEFLLDARGGFYFMEMNTRIQVEHPITEMITGVDLVEWQLRVAAGQPLPCTQEQITMQGHALEARLYAEVPEAGFLPSSGTLERFDLPAANARRRLETSVRRGDQVGIDYDPMLAKIVVCADSRAEALASLHETLGQIRIEGVGNNLLFLRRLVASEAVRGGPIDTRFIERTRSLWEVAQPVPVTARVAASLALVGRECQSAGLDSPWQRADGWRLNGVQRRTLQFESAEDGAVLEPVTVEYRSEGLWVATATEEGFARLLQGDGADEFQLQFAGEGLRLQIESRGEVWRIVIADQAYRVRLQKARATAPAGAGHADLRAPMPGRVIAQTVQAGDQVEKGAALLVLEAMKMEHTLCAPAAGVVRRFHAAVGQQVREGDELIEFEADA